MTNTETKKIQPLEMPYLDIGDADVYLFDDEKMGGLCDLLLSYIPENY